MEEKLTKQLAKKLMENEDEVRGIDFKTDEAFILKEKGEAGLKKVEKRMVELGYPIKYKKISPVAFYPMGLRILALLVIKEIFNFDEKKIKEMGEAAPKASLLIKIFMKFFRSIKELKKEIPRMWRRHHTTGRAELIIPEGDFLTMRLPGHSCRIRINDFKVHPIYCPFIAGFLVAACEMVIRTSPVTCEEIKCPFKGDEYHEFLLKW